MTSVRRPIVTESLDKARTGIDKLRKQLAGAMHEDDRGPYEDTLREIEGAVDEAHHTISDVVCDAEASIGRLAG